MSTKVLVNTISAYVCVYINNSNNSTKLQKIADIFALKNNILEDIEVSLYRNI